MAESKAQSILNRVSNVNVAGLPVGDVVGIVSDVFKRRPNVKAWAKAKRQERRRLKAQGLSGSEFRLAFQKWQQANPKPQGSDPYNPVDLGQSAQMDGNAMALNNNDVRSSALPGIPQTNNAGLGFNPLFLLFAVPFLFPGVIKNVRKTLKV